MAIRAPFVASVGLLDRTVSSGNQKHWRVEVELTSESLGPKMGA